MSYRLMLGDCRERLQDLEAESVHLCVTSPPYWNLRDYQIEGQIGLEDSPQEWIDQMVSVFSEVKRVLRKDGTCWVNLGDTYATGQGKANIPGGGDRGKRWAGEGCQKNRFSIAGIPDGSRIGIPWRFALALQADGWILRSAVVWHKPNPMPESLSGWRWERCRVKESGAAVSRMGDPGLSGESQGYMLGGGSTPPEERGLAQWSPCPGCDKCKDTGGLVLRKGSWRPTSSYEMVFQFANETSYFSDGEGVREAHQMRPQRRPNGRPVDQTPGPWSHPRQGWSTSMRDEVGPDGNPSGRNLRDVWTIPTQAYPGSHFATFPERLVLPIIKSGTSEKGVCPQCGGPWVRVVSKRDDWQPDWIPSCQCSGATYVPVYGKMTEVKANMSPIPSTVLDPFMGTGTVGAVCAMLGQRDFIGIELNPDYLSQAQDRIQAAEDQVSLLSYAEGQNGII